MKETQIKKHTVFQIFELYRIITDIVSDDRNRVILEEKNDKGTDYVNASYIDVSNILAVLDRRIDQLCYQMRDNSI